MRKKTHALQVTRVHKSGKSGQFGKDLTPVRSTAPLTNFLDFPDFRTVYPTTPSSAAP